MKLFNTILVSSTMLLVACGAPATDVASPSTSSGEKALTKDQADILAGQFVDSLAAKLGGEIIARHEIESVADAKRFTPPIKCFNGWYGEGGIILTPELSNECATHIGKVKYIYSTYGYDIPLDALKSPWLWEYGATLKDEDVRPLIGQLGLKVLGCAVASQDFYDDSKVHPFPDGRSFCRE